MINCKSISAFSSSMKMLGLLLLMMMCIPVSHCLAQSESEPIPQAGVNIISVGNTYADPIFAAGEVDRFMARLAVSGMQRISIRVTWETMEKEPGVFSADIIANLRRIAQAAERQSIKVMLDFHTLFSKNSYTAPQWLANYTGRNGKPGIRSLIMTVRNPEAGKAYLAMQRHVLTELRDVTGIEVVSLMNEPWPFWDEGPAGAREDMDATSDLLIESAKQVKSINPHWKTAIRFTSSFNPWSDDKNKRFDEAKTFAATNIIGINIYLDPSGKYDHEGAGADGRVRGGASWAVFERAVLATRASGRQLWVTEFGMSFSGNDSLGQPNSHDRQRQYYEAVCTRWWKGSPRPNAVMAWVLEPNLSSRQGKEIWDMKTFDWNPAGQVYMQYAKQAVVSASQN